MIKYLYNQFACIILTIIIIFSNHALGCIVEWTYFVLSMSKILKQSISKKFLQQFNIGNKEVINEALNENKEEDNFLLNKNCVGVVIKLISIFQKITNVLITYVNGYKFYMGN